MLQRRRRLHLLRRQAALAAANWLSLESAGLAADRIGSDRSRSERSERVISSSILAQIARRCEIPTLNALVRAADRSSPRNR